MAFLKKLVSSALPTANNLLNKTPQLPFSIEEQSYATLGHNWTLHVATPKKGSVLTQGAPIPGAAAGLPISAHQQFTAFKSSDLRGMSEEKVELMKQHAKRLKTLRHPNVVSFIDSSETDHNIVIVTEYVRPLKDVLRSLFVEIGYNETVSWGMYCIFKAIEFLNSRNLYIGNLSINSIFVDTAGEWKLGGELGFVSEINPVAQNQQGQQVIPIKRFYDNLENRYKAPELMSQRWEFITQCPDALDAFGAACLIFEVFEGELQRIDQLKEAFNSQKIPKTLLPQFRQLIHDNPTLRTRVAQLLESSYFDTRMIQTQLFLENLPTKEPGAIDSFFLDLAENIEHLPKLNCKYKIMPQLINAIKYGTGGTQAVVPLFRIAEMLDESEYRERFLPEVLDLFDVNSRTVRITLLKNLERMLPFLDNKAIESKVYPGVTKGFVDQDPTVRTETLKAIVSLVPRLKEKVVADEVCQYMWNLQADREPGIRVNTIVAFSKLAPNFSDDIRKRIVLHAFARALRDPYVHSRVAALKAFIATKEYYTVKEVALRILPSVSILTIDMEQSVREIACQVLQLYLQFVTEIAQSPDFHDFVNQTKTVAGGADQKQADTNSVWQKGSVGSLVQGAMNTISKSLTNIGKELDQAVNKDQGKQQDQGSRIGQMSGAHGTYRPASVPVSSPAPSSAHASNGGSSQDMFSNMNMRDYGSATKQAEKKPAVQPSPGTASVPAQQQAKPAPTPVQKQPPPSDAWGDDLFSGLNPAPSQPFTTSPAPVKPVSTQASVTTPAAIIANKPVQQPKPAPAPAPAPIPVQAPASVPTNSNLVDDFFSSMSMPTLGSTKTNDDFMLDPFAEMPAFPAMPSSPFASQPLQQSQPQSQPWQTQTPQQPQQTAFSPRQPVGNSYQENKDLFNLSSPKYQQSPQRAAPAAAQQSNPFSSGGNALQPPPSKQAPQASQQRRQTVTQHQQQQPARKSGWEDDQWDAF